MYSCGMHSRSFKALGGKKAAAAGVSSLATGTAVVFDG